MVALWKNPIVQDVGAGMRDSGSNTTFPTTSGNNSACVNNLFSANASGNFVAGIDEKREGVPRDWLDAESR